MRVPDSIQRQTPELTAWRQDFHRHPELGFKEERTSRLVAERLESFGLEPVRGLAETGVVAVIEGRGGAGATVGLRADMDALPMQEENTFEHRSTIEGVFHGCGHDGHTTMLLGVARHLAESRDFPGRVVVIFQPAEEGLAGARVMIEDGLFERFPCDEIYGLHNWPEERLGTLALRPGPVMAASDFFDIELTGQGAHAAMPHRGVDPIVVAAQTVTALQTLVSRSTNPLDAAVVSVTQVEAGSAYNVIPERAFLRGTCRTFKPEVRDAMEHGIERVAAGVAQALGARAATEYRRNYPPTVNHAQQTAFAEQVAIEMFGPENVFTNRDPSMGGEDFAFMLERTPGCYVSLGQGGGPLACNVHVHHPRYDFNDAALPLGVGYLSQLATSRLRAIAQSESKNAGS